MDKDDKSPFWLFFGLALLALGVGGCNYLTALANAVK